MATSKKSAAGAAPKAAAKTKIAADTAKSTPSRTTAARATSVPPSTKVKSKSSATPKTAITHELIAEAAYHLWLAGTPGSDHDRWCAAEKKLRGE